MMADPASTETMSTHSGTACHLGSVKKLLAEREGGRMMDMDMRPAHPLLCRGLPVSWQLNVGLVAPGNLHCHQSVAVDFEICAESVHPSEPVHPGHCKA